MLKKWWAAGILAGLLVFVWGFVSHMIFKLGESSLSKLPQEEATLAVMAKEIPQPGLYFFPYMEDLSSLADPTGLDVILIVDFF